MEEQVQIDTLTNMQSYLITVLQTSQQSLNQAKISQMPDQSIVNKQQAYNEIKKLKQQYEIYKNDILDLFLTHRNYRSSYSKYQDHKTIILENFKKYIDEANIYQTQEIENNICIGILWKTKIVTNIRLRRQESEEVYNIVDISMCNLNECKQEKERYKTEYEQCIMRHMRYERLRLNNTGPTKTKDELYEEIQSQEVARLMMVPVADSQYTLFESITYLLKSKILPILLKESTCEASYNISFLLKQCKLYSKVFSPDKHFTCTGCNQYMAYDSHFMAVMPPLHFKFKVVKLNQTINIYHSQCTNTDNTI